MLHLSALKSIAIGNIMIELSFFLLIFLSTLTCCDDVDVVVDILSLWCQSNLIKFLLKKLYRSAVGDFLIAHHVNVIDLNTRLIVQLWKQLFLSDFN